MNWYKLAQMQKMRGYKVMLWDPNTKEAISQMDKTKRFKPVIGKTYNMPGDGIYVGSTRDYVLKYFSNSPREEGDPYEVLLVFEFDPKDVVKGNLTPEYESEGSVRNAVLVEIEVLP
jgi:hypothetical protein